MSKLGLLNMDLSATDQFQKQYPSFSFAHSFKGLLILPFHLATQREGKMKKVDGELTKIVFPNGAEIS